MYECLFQDMHVRLLFDDFTMGVLCVLNVVLSQLHPNKWVAIQALQALSLYTYVKVNPIMFLHYFCCRPHKKALWVSLIRISSRPLFWMFTSLYILKYVIIYFYVKGYRPCESPTPYQQIKQNHIFYINLSQKFTKQKNSFSIDIEISPTKKKKQTHLKSFEI